MDNPRYVKSCPGIGVPAALWLATKDPMLLGADNWPVEVSPNPDKQLSLPVHQIALVVNGVHLLEKKLRRGLRTPLRVALRTLSSIFTAGRVNAHAAFSAAWSSTRRCPRRCAQARAYCVACLGLDA